MSAERVTVNQQVYFFDAKTGWKRGVILKIEGDKADVSETTTEAVTSVALTNIHGYMEHSYESEDPELFHVSDLHVATLLYCIKDRFENLHQQYSMMGEMVLSVNPFQMMAFNNEQTRKQYLAMQNPRLLPPHIWQVAHKAFNAVNVQGMDNQSIVISGESGSGKTENTKLLVAYLGQLSQNNSSTAAQRSIADKMDESLKWSNPVMESFGNARTVRNDNSSRFGKYIKLYFDPGTGVLVGGENVTYLLERSRIIMQSQGERNYHIFYEMLAGLSVEEKKKLGGLQTALDYKCLNGGKTFIRRGVDGRPQDDAKEFSTVRQALQRLGVPAEVEWSMLKVLAGILHLMNVEFESDNNDKAAIANEQVFLTGSKLLGLENDVLRECFLVKSTSSLVTILSTKVEAEGLRNAFCKGLYVGLFDRIVEFVNTSISPEVDREKCKYIGLLDIFGFEKFTRNSFEQLCINYANESLQNHYNKYTFINDEEECKAEGIEVPRIIFPDNSECVGMFDEKRSGIFSMLDEECHFKGGNSERFTANLWEQWNKKNNYFVQPKSTIPNEFGINHYAAFVQYSTDEWLEKNTDSLKDDMYACVAQSTDQFIRTLLATEKNMARRKQTVAIRFQQQLTNLRKELESTATQFIRCIKPNGDASPEYLDNAIVGAQLESAGVLQTIALKRQGYPVRRALKQFCNYFYLIHPSSTARLHKQGKFAEASQDFLRSYQRIFRWDVPNYAVGKTKVFLRAEVWSALERLALRRRAQLVYRCKPVLKRWIAEYREKKRIEEEKRREMMRKQREEREAKMASLANGLPSTQAQWVEELANTFPCVSMDTLLDVAGEASSKEEAVHAVLEIEKQRIDKDSAATLRDLLVEAQVRPEVIQNFFSCDITSVLLLSHVKPDDLQNYGCNEAEKVAITVAMTSQHTQRGALENFSASLGTTKEAQTRRNLQSVEETRHLEEFELKVKSLMSLGFHEEDCRLVLAHYNGNVERTAARLLYGINRNSIQKNVRKHAEYTTATPSVQRLIAMGASKQNAKMAMRSCGGDVDRACQMLFAVSN